MQGKPVDCFRNTILNTHSCHVKKYSDVSEYHPWLIWIDGRLRRRLKCKVSNFLQKHRMWVLMNMKYLDNLKKLPVRDKLTNDFI